MTASRSNPAISRGYFNFPGTGQMFSSAAPTPPLCDSYGRMLRRCAGHLAHCAMHSKWHNAQPLRQPATRAGHGVGESKRLDGTTIVDKPGGLDNASAYIGLIPDRKIGIVILSNRGDVHRTRPARSSCQTEILL